MRRGVRTEDIVVEPAHDGPSVGVAPSDVELHVKTHRLKRFTVQVVLSTPFQYRGLFHTLSGAFEDKGDERKHCRFLACAYVLHLLRRSVDIIVGDL